jgi:ribosomal protein S10
MADFAMRAAYYAKLPASGPVPLPKRVERWTVPRGNFVHKKSQENFERITYKRLIRIKDGNPETVELWLAFLKQHQYHGVGMKANVWGWDEIGTFFQAVMLFGLDLTVYRCWQKDERPSRDAAGCS